MTAVGISGLSSISTIASAQTKTEDTIDLPKIISGDEVIKYITVPEAWYSHVKHAREVKDRFQEQLGDLPGIFSVSLRRSSKTYGGKNGLKIMARVTDTGTTNNLPGEIEGIPIATEQAPEDDRWGPGCTNFATSSYVSGGQVLGWQNGGYGSACCKVTKDGNEYMLHCAHVFWDNCSNVSDDDLIGRVATVHDENYNDEREIGQVVGWDKNGDFAWIDHSLSTGDFNRWIDDNEDYPNVIGYVTRDALDYWMSLRKSNRPFFYNMGVNTGLTSGRLNGTGTWVTPNCSDYEGHGVLTFCDFGQGDSGGPTWHEEDGGAYLVSVTTHRFYDYYPQQRGCNDGIIAADSGGIGAYRLADHHGFNFGGAWGPIGDFDAPPTDPDGDGKYEDINGSGNVNVVDVQALFAHISDPVVQDNPDKFDFSGDGDVDLVDVQALFANGINA